MPYEVIGLGDTVKDKKGRIGTVIALGSPNNPRAHYLVRLSKADSTWYSRGELTLVEKAKE